MKVRKWQPDVIPIELYRANIITIGWTPYEFVTSSYINSSKYSLLWEDVLWETWTRLSVIEVGRHKQLCLHCSKSWPLCLTWDTLNTSSVPVRRAEWAERLSHHCDGLVHTTDIDGCTNIRFIAYLGYPNNRFSAGSRLYAETVWRFAILLPPLQIYQIIHVFPILLFTAVFNELPQFLIAQTK